ncbi:MULTISPECIES: catalase KatB [Shewanella]|jgi:catalase|uniref:catalase KatB n=1 Tax=Shewanella TaxID=22 RepID=UPI000EDEE251|nr:MULTISPECIES: catalase KatB [Shewanella]MBZ4678809.1 catalase [Shewanella sp.]MCA0949041.1 catalase KatB [Shewanella chilikensis]MCE9852087.1 catalase KatB [Shewanella chilikensis]MCL1163338.1 catalase KatB [Shewanella chilikensis]HCD13743.1 catalase [Shewanella sp.]
MSQKQYITSQSGAPIADDQNSLSAGERGPLLLQDWHLIEKLAHFNRERIPERVVHAKGTGVYGTFTVTNDMSQYTIAEHFQGVGTQTEAFVRFSTVGGEMGSADAERDPRGFGVRFYTKRGNHDIVGNNTPTFFLRDGIKFPDFIHTQKRNPHTNLKDPQAMWDFWSLNPESLHQVTVLMSDRGIPANYRQMHGFGSHTFSFWNAKGERFWVKFHFKTEQGIANLTEEQAAKVKGIDPDHAQRDMVAAIQDGNFPRWKLKVQIMPEADANTYHINPFDLTKVWPHKDYPLIEVGILELNRLPQNYFAEVEQVALAPSNLVPGVGASPDKMLQARLFAYADAQRYRIGANYNQLPVNCPHATQANHHQRAGAMAGAQCPYHGSQTGGDASANYGPNSQPSGLQDATEFKEPPLRLDGEADRYSRYGQDDYTQAGNLYRLLPEEEKARLISNICGTLSQATQDVQQRMIGHFSQADADYGRRVQEMLVS